MERTYPAPNTTTSPTRTYPAAASETPTVQHVGTMEGLISGLESYGCRVAHAEDFRIRSRIPLARTAPMIESVLGASPDEIRRNLSEYAIAEVGWKAAAQRHREVMQALERELIESMRGELDAYIEVLRPKFAEAAAEARRVVELGVQPTDDAERVMARGGQVSEAWISFKAGSRSIWTLTKITAIRASLAEATGAGEGPGADHAIGITRPFIPKADVARSRNEPEHVRWLRVAPHLDLVPFAELDPDDILRAQGEDVDELRAQAQRQLAADSAAATA